MWQHILKKITKLKVEITEANNLHKRKTRQKETVRHCQKNSALELEKPVVNSHCLFRKDKNFRFKATFYRRDNL